MRRRDEDVLISAVYDGESAPVTQIDEGGGRRLMADFGRLSALLRVPPAECEPDPNFVVRFRARRRAWARELEEAQPWRWLALRLVPLAASALITAGFVLWVSTEEDSALAELEVRGLGNGVADVTLESTEVEPVLRIALGEL